MDGSTAPLREPPPSADTQTGFFACTFYLVFKEPAFSSFRLFSKPARSPPDAALAVVRGTFQDYRTARPLSTFFALAEQVFLAPLELGIDGVTSQTNPAGFRD